MEYNRWVRNFLDFFRDINNLDYDEEDNVKNNIIQKDIFIWYLVEEFTDDFSTSIIFLINLSEDRPTKSIIQLSSSCCHLHPYTPDVPTTGENLEGSVPDSSITKG